VCAANLLIVAIYFRLPAVWDENFLLNEERIRHNEVISKQTIKNSKIGTSFTCKLGNLSRWQIFGADDVNISYEMIDRKRRY